MSFRFTCAICNQAGWCADNRNRNRKHMTHTGVCRRTWRTIQQKARRLARRTARMEAAVVDKELLVWHRPRAKRTWKKLHSSPSALSLTAAGHGKHTTSKGKYSASKRTSRTSRRVSRK